MKSKVVKFSEIDLACMSALRHLDLCEKCNRVMKCDLPEAKNGKIRIVEAHIAKITKRLKEKKEFLKSLTSTD